MEFYSGNSQEQNVEEENENYVFCKAKTGQFSGDST